MHLRVFPISLSNLKIVKNEKRGTETKIAERGRKRHPRTHTITSTNGVMIIHGAKEAHCVLMLVLWNMKPKLQCKS